MIQIDPNQERIIDISLPIVDAENVSAIIDGALYCYGMEFKCRREAKRVGSGESAIRLEHAADNFRNEARRLRRIL